MLHLALLTPLPILEEISYVLYVIKLVLVNMNACLKLKQNTIACFEKRENNLQFPTLAQHPIWQLPLSSLPYYPPPLATLLKKFNTVDAIDIFKNIKNISETQCHT